MTYLILPGLVAGGFAYCTRLPGDWQRNVLAITAAVVMGIFVYQHLLGRVSDWV